MPIPTIIICLLPITNIYKRNKHDKDKMKVFNKKLTSIVTGEKIYEPKYNHKAPLKLGAGTYGSVWRIGTESGDVAVKQAYFGDDEDKDGVDRSLLLEAGILAGVNHPNVIKILDVALSDTHMAIVLPLAKKTLRDYINDDYPNLSRDVIVANAKLFALQLARGIAYLHSLDILHGDLKPDNTLLYEEEGCPPKVVITDFGIASTAACYEYTIFHTIFTLWYRPPEILLDGKYTFAGDSWALGCMVAELLTSKATFNGDSVNEMLFLIFHRLGKPDETTWPGVTRLPAWSSDYLRQIQALKRKRPIPVTRDFMSVTEHEYDKSARYAYYRGDVRTALDQPEQDFLNALLVLDPKKRLRMSDVPNNAWLRETTTTLTCYSAPETQEESCSVLLMNRLPALRGDPEIVFGTLPYTYFYSRAVKYGYSDKTIALMISILHRYGGLKDPRKSIGDDYLFFGAAFLIAVMLTTDKPLSSSVLEKSLDISSKQFADAEQEIIKTIGTDLLVTTTYDLVKNYAQRYANIVFDTARTLLLFSYYTLVTVDTPIDLVALVCIMFACSATSIPFVDQDAITKYPQEEIESVISIFVSSVAAIINSVKPKIRKETFEHTNRGPIDSHIILGNIPLMQEAINPKYLILDVEKDVENLLEGLSKIKIIS